MGIVARRMTAKVEGDFVVFLIGARVNRWWKFFRYLWFMRSMPAMIAELEKSPESGFLGVQPLGMATMVQYWRSVDHLMAYARSRDHAHFPAWVRFNREIGSNGDMGIWHETYEVRAGAYECVYNNMPVFGLASIRQSAHVPADGSRQTAQGRLGRTDGTDAPVA